jgi:hypothetical protein
LYPIGGDAGEDGTDGFAAGFDEGRGTFGCAFGLLGRVHHHVAEGGERLGAELGVHGVLACRVDGVDAGDGALVLLRRGQLVELVEGDGVGLADGDGRHRRVEQVIEQVWCELG